MVSMVNCTSSIPVLPYDSKSMGLIWQFMAHIWPICGKDMEWLLDCMELIW